MTRRRGIYKVTYVPTGENSPKEQLYGANDVQSVYESAAQQGEVLEITFDNESVISEVRRNGGEL